MICWIARTAETLLWYENTREKCRTKHKLTRAITVMIRHLSVDPWLATAMALRLLSSHPPRPGSIFHAMRQETNYRRYRTLWESDQIEWHENIKGVAINFIIFPVH